MNPQQRLSQLLGCKANNKISALRRKKPGRMQVCNEVEGCVLLDVLLERAKGIEAALVPHG